MDNSILKRDEVFERTGLVAKWEARAIEKVARNAIMEGASLDFVQKITGLDIQTITSLTKSDSPLK